MSGKEAIGVYDGVRKCHTDNPLLISALCIYFALRKDI